MITEIWIFYPIYVEEKLQAVNRILDYLKRGTRGKFNIIKIEAYTLLFRLLDFFASDRNPYASIIYKKLTFSLMENHSDIEIREFLFRNFCYIFQKFHSIPCEVLIEPLVK